MTKECLICNRIDQIQEDTNPYFVAELGTGYVVLGDFQHFHGYTLFLFKQHVPELHHLEQQLKLRFLEEMSLVAEAVFKSFNPLKLNYELLGNSEPHLHWHLFPRHREDTMLGKPVWLVDKSIRYAETARPDKDQLHIMKLQLLESLEATAPDIIINRYHQ